MGKRRRKDGGAYCDGRRWSASASAKGSARKGYWMAPRTMRVLKSIEKRTGYGSSDVVNDAVILLGHFLVNSDEQSIHDLSERIALITTTSMDGVSR